MSLAEYELVARVGKARGLEGEVTATSVGDLPFCIYPGLRVHVVPPTMYGTRELVVSSVEEGTGSTYRLHFEEVESIDDAEQIAGRYLLADVLDLDDVALGDGCLGRMVLDERYGELGTIDEVIETLAHPVWVVHGPYAEVLIPVIDDVILSYPDDPADPIHTRVMDGLIEP